MLLEQGRIHNVGHVVVVGATLNQEDSKVGACCGKTPRYCATRRTTSSVMLVSGSLVIDVCHIPPAMITSTSMRLSGNVVYRPIVAQYVDILKEYALGTVVRYV